MANLRASTRTSDRHVSRLVLRSRTGFAPEWGARQTEQFFPRTSAAPVVIPRTRLLIPVLLLISVAASGVTIWNTFFRFQAFGVVTGRLVEASSPVDGVLQAVRYREGDDARQSDSPAIVISIDTDQRLAEIDDRLRVHQARISATLTQLRFGSERRHSEALEAAADASRAAAVLQEETGDLIVLQDHLSRLEKLQKASAGSEGERQSSLLKEAAASSRIEETRRAHGLLKECAHLLTETQRDTAVLIEPLLAETEQLLNEAERTRERQRLGEIRMPMNGTIIRRHHPTGEAVRAHEPLFTIVEESSLENEMFLTQSTANQFHVGDTLNVHLEPYRESVKCTVVAIGQELRSPPEQIQAWYVPKSQMVPFRLRPIDSSLAGSGSGSVPLSHCRSWVPDNAVNRIWV